MRDQELHLQTIIYRSSALWTSIDPYATLTLCIIGKSNCMGYGKPLKLIFIRDLHNFVRQSPGAG
jgi:hypothetical protein